MIQSTTNIATSATYVNRLDSGEMKKMIYMNQYHDRRERRRRVFTNPSTVIISWIFLLYLIFLFLSSLIDRHRIDTNHFTSDNENSPFNLRQSRLSLNNSINSEENIPTPIQLIALYEKTIELIAKNKINSKNAFHISLVERLPEVIDLIAFDDKTDSNHHEPNFVKVGSVIDTR
jgi:hypothetical protein